jgi:hypothetical protein
MASFDFKQGLGASNDQTGRNIGFQCKVVTYGATLVLAPNSKNTEYSISLTGACALNLGTENADLGDQVTILLKADGTARTTTWGANISTTTATLVTAINKTAVARFIFSGTKWIQLSNVAEQ